MGDKGTVNSTSSFPTLLKNGVNYTLNVSNCAASGSSGVTFTLTATANDTFNNTSAGSLSTTTPSSGGGDNSMCLDINSVSAK